MKSSPQILLVDSEPLVLGIFKQLLEEQEYQVICAREAMEACRLMDEFSLDLLICDSMIEQITGLELARIFCEKEQGARVIIASGTLERQEHETATKLGYGYLLKPVSEKRLLKEVDKALSMTEISPLIERPESKLLVNT